MRRLAVGLLAAIMGACGGYAVAPDEPVVVAALPAPAAASAPVAEAAPSAHAASPVAPPAPAPAPTLPPEPETPEPAPPEPVAAPLPPAPVPLPLWAEDWMAPVISGVVVQPIINCHGQQADPQDGEWSAFFPSGATWGMFGSRAQIAGDIVSATGGSLVVDSLQTPAQGGWAILSAARFDPAVQLVLEGTIELQPDAGAWISLPLIHGEGDYRQISLREDNGQITADLGAPCFYQVLGTYPPGPRRLALGWHPINGWTYSIDGVLLHTEPITHNRADLAGPVRVGLYVVNVGVEAGRLSSGVVRATVSPLRVMGNQ